MQVATEQVCPPRTVRQIKPDANAATVMIQQTFPL
jgi:hypothetical protein